METFEEYLERRKNELLQEKPQDVSFTFTKEQIQQIIEEYNQQHNKASNIPIYDDWERGTWGGEAYYTSQNVINAVEAYNNLSDKNDFEQVGTIAGSLEHMYNGGMQLPPEIVENIIKC